MNTKLSPLELLKKFLKEEPKEKIDKIISDLEGIKYEGVTVEEYFSNFNEGYSDFYNNIFCPVEESDYIQLWDSLRENLCAESAKITRKEIIDVVSKEQQDFTKSMPNRYALAA